MSGRTDDIPCKPVREDQKGHFDISLRTRGRCKNPGCKGRPVTYCLKCKVFLCNTNLKRCFLIFHGVDFDKNELPH